MASGFKFTIDTDKLLNEPEAVGPGGLMTSLYPKKRPTNLKTPPVDKAPEVMSKVDKIRSDFATIARDTQGEEEVNKMYGVMYDNSPTLYTQIRTNLLDRWGFDTTVPPTPPRDTPAKPQMELPRAPYMLDASNVIDDVPVEPPVVVAPTTSLRPKKRPDPVADAGEGLMTRPKARPTGLNSPSEIERTKAVQTIIGAKSDGKFGKGSKAKLKAWQYVHELPTTGELDEITIAALKENSTYDPREITRDDFIQTPTFDLLKGVEGFEEDAYIGKISANFKSGLTVGAGIDFGQHTRQGLLDKGLPVTLVDKADAAGWLGLNPDTIVDPNTGLPASQGAGTHTQRRARGETLLKAKAAEQKTAGTFPEFSVEELYASTPTMYKPYSDAAKKDYDRVEGAGSFDALSEGTKATLATEKYHRGEDYDISYMFDGARSDNPILAAEGIALERRRENMKDWLRSTGLD